MSRQSSTASSQSVVTQLTSPEPSDDFRAKDIGSTAAFRAWRPSYHFIAPTGWMNDPCAPGYDPKTGLYHVSYQANPKSADWGDISWGSATSPDMIVWTFSEQPSLSPDAPYDGKGVFTGCMIHGKDGSLNYAYTSVSALPIHHTLAHPKGSESLSLATSHDGGKTWEKAASNPILPSEPEHLDVTGWRDPFVSKWPNMANMLGVDANHTLFGIISGGIRDVTPTTFLYAINAHDLAQWKYVGPLASFGLNLRPSRWSGDLGRNWEVTNFCTLQDQDDPSVSRDFLVMGTEGCLPDSPGSKSISTGPTRPLRGQLWMSGSLRPSKESPISGPITLDYGFGGHLDHGCLYAANSFFDPTTKKQIVWGWITEEDLCADFRHRQGWSGLLALPREIRIQTLQHVIGAWNSELADVTSIEREYDSHGSYTVRTLASQPLQSVIDGLRKGASVRRARLARQLVGSSGRDLALTSDEIRSTQWELDCSFRVSRRCKNIGFSLVHSRGESASTLCREMRDD